ncbi:MAG: efflux RND transporter periplasmic adaptor subunit [Gemmatimonadaceae bacterium]|nr:efflux RND transporter periplasmic adaptor subunit [Gemmatimonadaceae bacterium]
MKRIRIAGIAGAVAAGAIVTYVIEARSAPLVLTGIVTTNDVLVSPLIGGQVGRLLVSEGDSVARGQLLAVITPDELQADQAYYAHSAEGLAVQVRQSEAALRYQEQQTAQQIHQAEAMLAATEAQRAEVAADYENAKRNYERAQTLARSGAVSDQDVDQQRTAYAVAKAKLDAVDRQLEAQRATLAMARAAEEQVAMKRSALVAAEQERAAAVAQSKKAAVRLGYTEIRSPVSGIVDVRAVRPGETVTAGQPLLTLIDPDDLWVRADVEESYIDRIRIGDSLTVRLPSGETRRGRVFYRGVDAGFATQRDVSRTKRDIKTFEIRLRVDNHDRRLAVGMTAYVLLPVS